MVLPGGPMPRGSAMAESVSRRQVVSVRASRRSRLSWMRRLSCLFGPRHCSSCRLSSMLDCLLATTCIEDMYKKQGDGSCKSGVKWF